MQPPINPNRDKDMTEYLYAALRSLPDAIGGFEALIATLSNAKRDAEMRRDDAELNATLTAPNDGKNEAARKAQRDAAITGSAEYKSAREEVNRLEDEINMQEAEAKTKRREFMAAVALSELHAARINLMSKIQTAKDIEKK